MSGKSRQLHVAWTSVTRQQTSSRHANTRWYGRQALSVMDTSTTQCRRRHPSQFSASSTIRSFSTRQRELFKGGVDDDEFSTDPDEDDEESDDDEDEDEDDDDDDDSEGSGFMLQQPWKTLLEAPGRAAWRVADPHPPRPILQALDTILTDGDRTQKQLKRAHATVLERHRSLAEFRERERRRMVNGKYFREKNAAAENDDLIHPVYYGYDETLSNLRYRLLPNYSVARRVLEECQSLLGPDIFTPRRVLDFGMGCGSASVAALDLFPDTVEWIHGIDSSQPMRDCSQRMLDGMAKHSPGQNAPRVTFSTSLSTDNSSSDGSSSGGTFDLALCAYAATDLPDITSTLAAAAIMFEKLKPNGVLVVIEPGTPDGFNSIRSIRNMLLDCCPPHDPAFEWEERCHIVAPCTHNGQCPMVRHKKEFVKKGKLAYDLPQDLEGDESVGIDVADYKDVEEGDFAEYSSNHGKLVETDAFNSSFCSFVHTIPGSDSKKGEKFSYLVAQKRLYGSDEEGHDPFREDSSLSKLLAEANDAAAKRDDAAVQQVFRQAQDLESRYLDSDDDNLGLELLRGETKRESMGRIVRAPIKKKGHIYIDYCASPGRIIRSHVAKSSSNVAPGIWNAARKSRWGGLWPDTMDKVFTPNK